VGTRVHSAGFELDLDPAIPVDRMSRAILLHLRESILEGKRPDGKGSQKALGAKAAAIPGRQSPFRGYRTGVLADGLRRLRIKTSGNKATTRILGPTTRNVYLAQEAKKGVRYITGAGAVGDVAKAAALEVMKEVLKGKSPKTDKGEEEAGDL
jgi:hypothetical protein